MIYDKKRSKVFGYFAPNYFAFLEEILDNTVRIYYLLLLD
jgi:hypothetical protein